MSGNKSSDEEAKELEKLLAHMDQKKFRGSVSSSLVVAGITLAGLAFTWYIAYYLKSNVDAGLLRTSGLLLLTLVWAAWVVRSFMIFHDCGHGSFIQGFQGAATWNNLCCHVFAVACGTPTDWNVGHKLHHMNVGNITQDDYDWAETIFHTKTTYLSMPKWKRRLISIARHPLPFFTLAPLLTWYFKMRLPFELRPGRKAAYRFSDKMLNLAFMVARYTFAFKCGILSVILLGDYLAMSAGIILFHCQHVYDPGYVTEASKWTRHEASLLGSSMLKIPFFLRWVTLGIEYHHIHHLRVRMPGYALQYCHESAPKEMWKDVVVLDFKDMWNSLGMTIYDDERNTYSTFAEVEKTVKTS